MSHQQTQETEVMTENTERTIALRIEMNEDWGRNTPEVFVMSKGLRCDDITVGRLTPDQPVAHVCITKFADLYFKLADHTAHDIKGPYSKSADK